MRFDVALTPSQLGNISVHFVQGICNVFCVLIYQWGKGVVDS